MPRNKDLKRLVRARMGKTGESYTASRASIVARSPAATRTAASPSRPLRSDYAGIAGTADATIEAKTGRSWTAWVAALDHLGAVAMAHRDIAALVNTKFGVDGWWAQTVTVGYERIKGLRARGQRRDGSYEVGKSRTFAVPVATLFAAWADARVRARWLDKAIGRVRTAAPNKSMRLDGPHGSIVVVGFVSKGPSKSALAVQHTKLRDRDTANQLKQYWSERLDALGAVLATTA